MSFQLNEIFEALKKGDIITEFQGSITSELIDNELILAGHDVSAGGLITTLLEMVFAENEISFEIPANYL